MECLVGCFHLGKQGFAAAIKTLKGRASFRIGRASSSSKQDACIRCIPFLADLEGWEN